MKEDGRLLMLIIILLANCWNKNFMHLRPVFFKCARFSTKLSVSSQQAIAAFKEQYPIAMGANQPRQNPFHLNLQELSTFDYLSYSLLLWVQNRRSSSWIDKIFGQNPNSSYLETEFLGGAEMAITSFFELLNQNWNLENSDDGALHIKDILSPGLYDTFKTQHSNLGEVMNIDVRLNKLRNIRKEKIWVQFGPPDRVTTTLQKAPFHTLMAPSIGWRRDSKLEKWLFREATLEYDLDLEDMGTKSPADPLPVSERERFRKMGAVVGVDVYADVNATVFIKSKDNVSHQWVNSIARDMVFRFESPHMVTSCAGGWKIADVDNFFASKLTK
jgi:hypothetical protein